MNILVQGVAFKNNAWVVNNEPFEVDNDIVIIESSDKLMERMVLGKPFIIKVSDTKSHDNYKEVVADDKVVGEFLQRIEAVSKQHEELSCEPPNIRFLYKNEEYFIGIHVTF